MKFLKFFSVTIISLLFFTTFNTVNAQEIQLNDEESSFTKALKNDYEQLLNDGVLPEETTYEEWLEMAGIWDNDTSFDFEEIFDEEFEEPEFSTFATQSIKKGDILISNRTSKNGLTGHSGIALSSTTVLHISGPGYFPQVESLANFKKKYKKTLSVYRVPNSKVANAAANWASSRYVGKKYSYFITDNIKSVNPTYCSKIVFQAYYYGSGSAPVIKTVPKIALPYGLPGYFSPQYKPKLITRFPESVT